MFEPVDRAGFVKFDSPLQRKRFRQAFKKGMNAGLSSSASLMAFDDFEVLRIEEIKTHIDNTSDPEGAYEMVLDYILEEERHELARALFAHMKKDFPESDLLEYYEEILEEPNGGHLPDAST